MRQLAAERDAAAPEAAARCPCCPVACCPKCSVMRAACSALRLLYFVTCTASRPPETPPEVFMHSTFKQTLVRHLNVYCHDLTTLHHPVDLWGCQAALNCSMALAACRECVAACVLATC